jgi:hypothetical protein
MLFIGSGGFKKELPVDSLEALVGEESCAYYSFKGSGCRRELLVILI